MLNIVMCVECMQYKSRPSVKEWKSMKECPDYKNDNTLREYQLEGLNWLLFCYHSKWAASAKCCLYMAVLLELCGIFVYVTEARFFTRSLNVNRKGEEEVS